MMDKAFKGKIKYKKNFKKKERKKKKSTSVEKGILAKLKRGTIFAI